LVNGLVGIGETVKPKKISKLLSKKLVRSRKNPKYGENEHKSSLGCHRQKPIGALNSTRTGGNVKPK
jgi:hypothetical protein